MRQRVAHACFVLLELPADKAPPGHLLLRAGLCPRASQQNNQRIRWALPPRVLLRAG
jgi:hypothetical protein